MSAVAPIISGRVGEDRTGAVFEYVPPNLAPLSSGGLQNMDRAFGSFTAPGTITIPAGYAIIGYCTLETGGVSTTGSTFAVGTTPNGYDVFYQKITANLLMVSLSLQIFYSQTSPTTLYVSNSGTAWPAGMVVNVTLVLVKMIP